MAAIPLPRQSPPPALLSAAPELKWRFLQGCRSFQELKHLHARLLRLGLDGDQYLLNLLLRSSFDSGQPAHALLLFRRTDHPNLYLWNNMVRGLVAADNMADAVHLYTDMRREGLSPNNFTFPFVLKACARLFDLDTGVKIHAHVLKAGFELDVFVKTSLLCLYAKCGLLDEAQRLFDEMPVRNVVSWTAIISGYMGEGRLVEALDMFRRSLEMDLRPDSFTLVRVLTACSQLGDLKTGEWIHQYIEDKGMEKNVFVATSLVDMYTKCGSMDKARAVFDGMVEKDVVSWSAMIGGYSSSGLPQEALELFFQMQAVNVRPDCFTMVGVLSACARLGALELGQQVSRQMDMNVFLSNPVLGTALIDMYAKCGSTAQAWTVFKRMMEKDVIVWNAMITGLAMTGHGKVSFGLFAQIEKMGVQPDGNTFIGILCSCTHTGLVEDGRKYFYSMNRVYNLTPRIEHYGCMVDLLGRAGLLEEAHRLIKEMPMEANAVVWGALLGGCRIHRNTQLAELVLKQLIELEPRNSGNYVLLSNIYATSGKWEDAAKLRLVMKEKGIQKTPGRSWIELKGVVHEFHVGDKSHPLSKQIYSKLDELGKQLKALGYMPTTEVVLFDIEEEEKEHSLGHHSEKLAIAFGLISTRPDETIRVVKNLRVCNDCHEAIKLISKIINREVIVRDNNRYHCFKDGLCSCNDYW
ncbi:putative pentatricopeptide repeat-containing protein At3g08820 [Elaeis guineensis]|uniref:Pentatricopeptide repeat-containing protein At3g08820 n=1 Tax=Elaeis guineensis var. tenera TaxID=51953 RepID=A0A6I9R8M1_ELAGV|nr:putative pentatricopeptide repeat-containing protein At3g08820 [Elaeis guineensis]